MDGIRSTVKVRRVASIAPRPGRYSTHRNAVNGESVAWVQNQLVTVNGYDLTGEVRQESVLVGLVRQDPIEVRGRPGWEMQTPDGGDRGTDMFVEVGRHREREDFKPPVL
ncbi:hypothetical protein DL765_004006 [Monosporascus sp. GIB2]|nr:hypothetical protein DL765_004006 [Monosporascus sp. GIB2]